MACMMATKLSFFFALIVFACFSCVSCCFFIFSLSELVFFFVHCSGGIGIIAGIFINIIIIFFISDCRHYNISLRAFSFAAIPEISPTPAPTAAPIPAPLPPPAKPPIKAPLLLHRLRHQPLGPTSSLPSR